jgi:hypothetical protein
MGKNSHQLKHHISKDMKDVACDTVGFMKRLCLTLFLATLALTSAGQDTPQTSLPRIKLQAGMHQIDAQVAQTPEQRSIGLMLIVVCIPYGLLL